MAIDFRLTASQRELQLRSRKFAKEVLSPAIEAVRSLSLRARPCLRHTGPQRAGIGGACEGVWVGDSGARDLGSYARRWDRKLRSHVAAWRPARRRARITAVRWGEHGRSATAAAHDVQTRQL